MESTSNAASVRIAVPASTSSSPIRVGLLGTINVLDPRRAADYVSGMILDQIFDAPYAAVEGQASAAPLLFEPLQSEDGKRGLRYSAAVRPGIFFSEGTPLTAELAARSLKGAGVLVGKAAVDVRGDRVWFTLASPNSRFDLALTQSGCAIVLEKGSQLHGTGPYMFEDAPNVRQLQQSPQLRLIRNPRFHGKAPAGEVEFHAFRQDADGTPRSLIEALRDGAIDITPALSASDLVTWQLPGVTPVIKPANSTSILFMNTTRPLLATAAARQGIASTIDLLEIASRCYDRNPAAFVATTALPPAMSRNGGALRMGSADGARLIGESGLRGARLTLVVPWCPRPYLTRPLAVAEIIRKRLGEAGVSISLIETKTSEEFFRYLTGGGFDLALAGWIAETPDPVDFFEAVLSSHVIGHGTFANCSRWNDPATDALLERFRVDPSDVHRREIERIVSESVPFLPLVYGQSSAVHTRRVRNVVLSATGSIALEGVRIAQESAR